MNEPAVAAAIETAAVYLIGQDPMRITALSELINRQSYFRGGVILHSALSGIDAALYDIKGKAMGQPVYDLLGGRVRDGIRAYANAWFTGAKTPEVFATKARTFVDLGYTALKWDPFESTYMDLTQAELIASMECVEAVRAAVPRHIDLLIEGPGAAQPGHGPAHRH